jgi:CRISPR-associated protein Cas1
LFLGDLQEPFRWIADVTVMEAFESEALDLPDFYFTGDDYTYRLDREAKQRFLESLRERFNSGVRYRGRALKWDTAIRQKTVEFGQYLMGRNSRLDFSEPSPIFGPVGYRELREAVLNLSQPEARQRGIGRSTLHNLRRKAGSERSFKVYRRLLSKLQSHRRES